MSSVRTRSSAKNQNNVDLTYYTTLDHSDKTKKNKNKIQVISKNRLKPTDEGRAILEEKFQRIERNRLEKLRNEKNNSYSLCLWVTHFNVFLYAAGFFIQLGTLPYLSKKLGADPTMFGQLQTLFAVVQLLGSPLYGRLGDVLGEKLALIMAFAASTSSYLMLAMSNNIFTLFLSRLPSVLMHVMQGSQMLVANLSEGENRAVALSRLGFSYGLGMVIGPTLGGFVSKHYDEQSAALLSAVTSLVSLILVIFFVPKNIDKKLELESSVEQEEKQKKHSSNSIFDLQAILKILQIDDAKNLLLIRIVCGVPIGVLQSMFSVIAMEQFGLAPDQNGLMMSYIGGISLFMQGVGILFFKRFFDDSPLMTGSVIVLTATYYLLTLLGDITSFIILLLPLTCALCLVNSILTASVTKKVTKSDTGTVLGLNMATNSSIRTVAPTMGGYMLKAYGFSSIGYLGVACNLATLWIIRRADIDF